MSMGQLIGGKGSKPDLRRHHGWNPITEGLTWKQEAHDAKATNLTKFHIH